jgi:predicted dehydrogenase
MNGPCWCRPTAGLTPNGMHFCEEFGDTGVLLTISEFLAGDVAIVVLCTPNGTHLDYGMQAADAGKHLIIEKPLEVTVERGMQLVEHCKFAGCEAGSDISEQIY